MDVFHSAYFHIVIFKLLYCSNFAIIRGKYYLEIVVSKICNKFPRNQIKEQCSNTHHNA